MNIYSMTGFGRAEFQNEQKRIAVEIRSVNHRYLECGMHLPGKLHALEAKLRAVLKEYAQRGKVDVRVSCEDLSAAASSLHYNASLAAEILGFGREAEKAFDLTNDLTVSRLLSFPDVLYHEEETQDVQELLAAIEPVFREAAEAFMQSRLVEGQGLGADILEKLSEMEDVAREIAAHEPEIMEAYRQKIRDKVAELLDDKQLEESRIAAELVLYADRICTDEEVVRLQSHISRMRETLESGGAVGRKLDFLAQEMNREANTILSKAGDVATSDLGVTLKTSIEKIREQIQNLE